MKKLVVLVLLIALAVGGWYAATPWMAMNGIVEAARNRDVTALEERIDFARLREDARANLRGEIERRTGEGDMLDAIGGAFAGRIADSAVEAVVTPEGVANMVTAGAVAMPFVPDRYRGQTLEWDVERSGLNAFAGVSTWADGGRGPVLHFERDGLGWKLVGFDLPR